MHLTFNAPKFARKILAHLLILASGCLAFSGLALASGTPPNDTHKAVAEIPAALNPLVDNGSAPAGVTDLKFHEFFKLPVGPRGLEPSEKLMALDGKKVRIVGFMARQETPIEDVFIFTPVPVTMGDEDEALADDLPASVVFVHAARSEGKSIPFMPGLLRLTGTLLVGAHEEADGHVSTVRLQLDPELSSLMLAQQQ